MKVLRLPPPSPQGRVLLKTGKRRHCAKIKTDKEQIRQATGQKSATLTYDDAGNCTSQAVTQISGTYNPTYNPQPSVSGLTTYTWDTQDRLASVTLPNGSVHRYAYDYRTRRVGTVEQTLLSADEKRTAIVFSGGLSVAEYENTTLSWYPTPIISDLSSPTVEYTRGPDMGGGVGGLLYTSRSESASVSSSRVLRYNLSNGRGDIVAQSDAYAALTWTASYEAYGKRTKETGENKDKQRGNSKDEDPTGLLNEGFRCRDIETGVWLSRDPAGFVDGPNLYAYVKQNPWSYFDPLGLEEVPVARPGNVIEFFAPGSDTFKRDTELEKGVLKAAAKPENAKRLVVGIHGTAKFVQDSNNKKIHGEMWLSKQIKDHPNFKDSESVLLLSCNTGNTKDDKNPIAARVAKRLDKEVEAPSDYGWISEDGRYGAAPAKPKSKEENLGQLELDHTKPSKMNLFDRNGKLKGGTPTEDPTKVEKKPSFWHRFKNVFKKKDKES